jgi:hypothetical protein
MTENDMPGSVFRETGPGKSQGKAKAKTRNHHKGTKDTKNASSCPCDSSLCTLCLSGESSGYILPGLGLDLLASPFSRPKEFAMQSHRQQIEQSLTQHYPTYIALSALSRLSVSFRGSHKCGTPVA